MRVKFPTKIGPILTPAPYKVLFGGRGKGASWAFARAMLIMCTKRKLFCICTREIQRSIRDSVHKLLKDQITALGLDKVFEVLDTEIRCLNGSVIAFDGLNNIDSFKSKEAIDILWCTEAQRIPKTKWNILLPTVRRDPPFGPFKQGSEIWIDFNPDLATDDTYKMMVVDPPDGAIVIELNYRDNPFFPEILQRQMTEMRNKDYEEYLTVWEGKTRKSLSGAIYAKEIVKAVEDGRIGPFVRHDASRPVVVSFDLGDDDMTAYWVWQQIGNQHFAIDYYENCGEGIQHFIEKLQEKKYLIRNLLLPHDAGQSHQAARGLAHNTIEKQAKAIYPTPGIVKIVPKTSKVLRINAVRGLFSRISINDSLCSQGLMCLQHYQFAVDPISGQRSKEPLHNWASHGADAFGYYATQLREGTKKEREAELDELTGLPKQTNAGNKFKRPHAHSWLGG